MKFWGGEISYQLKIFLSKTIRPCYMSHTFQLNVIFFKDNIVEMNKIEFYPHKYIDIITNLSLKIYWQHNGQK